MNSRMCKFCPYDGPEGTCLGIYDESPYCTNPKDYAFDYAQCYPLALTTQILIGMAAITVCCVMILVRVYYNKFLDERAQEEQEEEGYDMLELDDKNEHYSEDLTERKMQNLDITFLTQVASGLSPLIPSNDNMSTAHNLLSKDQDHNVL